jgi:hypothetical protein
VNDFRRSSNIVALVVQGNCANQLFFKKDTVVLSLGCIAVLQSYKLRTTWWLATRHVDEEEKLFKELIYLVKVCLYCLLLPLKLRFWAYSNYLVP